MTNNELIEIVKEMAYSGKEYDEIKKELQSHIQASSPEAINFSEQQIDDYVIKYQLAIHEKSKVLSQIVIGIILLLLGLGILVYTYFSNHSQYVLPYGAILAGAWILKEGYKKYQRPIEDFVPKKSKFKRLRKMN